MYKIGFILITIVISTTIAGISPVHDFQTKINYKALDNRFYGSTTHKVLKHLDETILKSTSNLTNNEKMDQTLYQLSKDLVSSVLSILEIQDKITRITKEALDASGKNKRITAIETRRILDYISRTLSNNILRITRESTEYELHHLVYGLAQIATETSIVSALKDTTFATILSKKQTIDLSLRKKRSVKKETLKESALVTSSEKSIIYDVILNKTQNTNNSSNTTLPSPIKTYNLLPHLDSPYTILKKVKPVHVVNMKSSNENILKHFLNKTALDADNNERMNQNLQQGESATIVLEKKINVNNSRRDPGTLDTFEPNAFPSGLTEEWPDNSDNIQKQYASDAVAEIEIDQDEVTEEARNEKRAKQKLERLESKAKKAILYAGDVAYLTAASVVAMRRALTASTEVQMSVNLAKSGMSNHQDLMMNLAKTAAQQVGKEAKIAASKSLASERMLKLAVKYTAQSNGAILNHVANRIVLNTLSLSTLAKAMASASSDIAINSLYIATDVKPPSK